MFISKHVGFFTFQTFRKPLCSYCYTPAYSCHNPSIFRAIVKTELIRLLRTNFEEGTFLYHVEFFVGKLQRCGYALPMVREIVDSVPWRDKHRILSRTVKTRILTVPFTMTYAAMAEEVSVSETLNRHRHIIRDHFDSETKFLTAFRTSPNLFRLRYSKYL